MTVDIIIPSFDNPVILNRCLESVQRFTSVDYHLIVINNGSFQVDFHGEGSDFATSLSPGENLGWTRAINYAREYCRGDFVVMMNDDTQIPDHDSGWLQRLLLPFQDKPAIGATGPISNYAMGYQNIENANFFSANAQRFIVPVLSGFCMCVRRSVLDELGWLDEDFQEGAEDVEFSLSMRKAGYDLAVCRDVFIYHIGSVTANKLHGSWWNSNLYSIEQRMKVMRKHGVKSYFKMMNLEPQENVSALDPSRELLKSYIKKGMKGLDIGCGPNKLVKDSIGVDMVLGTIQYGRYRGFTSQADIKCDIEKGLPFEDNSQDYVLASHILEHISDLVLVLDEIQRVLKVGGKALITMPSQEKVDVVPLDPTHLHGFTPKGFSKLMTRITSLSVERCENILPGYNFVCVAEKVPVESYKEEVPMMPASRL